MSRWLSLGSRTCPLNNTPWIVDDYANGTNSSRRGPDVLRERGVQKLIVNEKRNFDMGDFRVLTNQGRHDVAHPLRATRRQQPRTQGVMTALAS